VKSRSLGTVERDPHPIDFRLEPLLRSEVERLMDNLPALRSVRDLAASAEHLYRYRALDIEYDAVVLRAHPTRPAAQLEVRARLTGEREYRNIRRGPDQCVFSIIFCIQHVPTIVGADEWIAEGRHDLLTFSLISDYAGYTIIPSDVTTTNCSRPHVIIRPEQASVAVAGGDPFLRAALGSGRMDVAESIRDESLRMLIRNGAAVPYAERIERLSLSSYRSAR
jgi:hypothetical protein